MGEYIYPTIASGIAQENRLEVLANNLANVNTIGYKADRPIFDISYLSGQGNVSQGLGKKDLSSFSDNFIVTLAGLKIDFAPGTFINTGNNFDLAIEGDGFFVLDTPKGKRYTRQGSFGLNAQGVLVNELGYPVSGERGEITINGGQVHISNDGVVQVNGKEIDKIQVVDFPKPYALKKEGGAIFVAPPGQEEMSMEDEIFKIKQGYLEMANVNAIKELTEMMGVLRAYESYQKIIQTLTEANSKAINQVGKTG